jgi:hypothetical protein
MTTRQNELTIASVGLPPEQHADRITGGMMHLLARRYTTALDAVWKMVLSANDGGPRAQAKLCERIAQTGDVFSVELRPGKRGRYRISMTALTGWDPRRSALIRTDDPVPVRPWLAGRLVVIKSEGNGRKHRVMDAFTILLITHHAMSRAAQRLGLRTIEDMISIAGGAIFDAAMGVLVEKVLVENGEAFADAPPKGWRVTCGPNKDMVAVLKKHERLPILVATTVFGRGDGSED